MRQNRAACFSLIFLVCCIIAGVTMGNYNALREAVWEAENGFFTVADAMSKRVDTDRNLLTLAKRVIPAEKVTTDLTEALTSVKITKEHLSTYHALVAAEQGVLSALDIADTIGEKDVKLLASVKNNILDAEYRFQQAIHTYNLGWEIVVEVYNKLPMRWALTNPKEGKIQ